MTVFDRQDVHCNGYYDESSQYVREFATDWINKLLIVACQAVFAAEIIVLTFDFVFKPGATARQDLVDSQQSVRSMNEQASS